MQPVTTISLDESWVLEDEAGGMSVELDLPCTVHEALLAAGIIDDPFHGSNEQDVAWVHETRWIYRKQFTTGMDVLSREHVFLEFHGLDTIATITLNDVVIAHVDNMFISHSIDVKTILVNGENVLSINFESPTDVAKHRIEELGVRLKTQAGKIALEGVPYLRKAQYSFGWDWGPKLPAIGPWKGVALVTHDGGRIDSVHVTSELEYGKDPDRAAPVELPSLEVERARVTVEITVSGPVGMTSTFILDAGEKPMGGQSIAVEDGVATCTFTVDAPRLWWTRDLGEAFLHDLTIQVLAPSGKDVLDERKLKVGIREIKLVRKRDKWGESFYFRINGVPLFAKGANWIPVDSFIPRGAKNGLYERTLELAADAGMNMIRVWGGGIYESEQFYSCCDKLGLLVWQDFPFACAIYPLWGALLKSVEEEGVQNIKRIRNHASLALWCGNNEIEMLMVYYLLQPLKQRPGITCRFKKAYKHAFHELLPALVSEHDGSTAYWPSSPSNGMGRKWQFSNPRQSKRGDSHYWMVWHAGRPFSAYRSNFSRFMSEYGFESFPEMKTIKAFCPPDQFRFDSPVMENHQKNLAGNKKIMDYMARRFSIPSSFEKQVMLSQLTQAEAIEYGIEHWRRNRNEHRCMGSLYWQLNDCWPVASWSSVDYFGRPKALHYLAKRAHGACCTSIEESKSEVNVWAVNDTRRPRHGTAWWKIVVPDGTVVDGADEALTLPPCSVTLVRKVNLREKIQEAGFQVDQLVVFHGFDSDDISSEGFRFVGAPRDVMLQEPRVTMEAKVLERGDDHACIEIVLASQKLAVHVHVTSPVLDFTASDNFIALVPGKTRKIILRTREALPERAEISDLLQVHSLYDLLEE